MVVVDPPFITQGVWESYSVTTKLLLKKGYSSDGTPNGRVILTTLEENADMLKCLLGAEPTVSDIVLITCEKRFYASNYFLITVSFFYSNDIQYLSTFTGFPA
jgi:Probable N6-adenine methyltransferase